MESNSHENADAGPASTLCRHESENADPVADSINDAGAGTADAAPAPAPAAAERAAALRRADLHQRQLKWKQLLGLEQVVTEGSFTEVGRLDSFDGGGGGGGGGGDGGGAAAVPVCTNAMGDSDARTDPINDAGAGTQAVPVSTNAMGDSDARTYSINDAGAGTQAVPVCTIAMGDSDARTDSINDAGAGTQAVPVCTMCRNESGVGKRACICYQPIATSNADSPSQNQTRERPMRSKQPVCSASSSDIDPAFRHRSSINMQCDGRPRHGRASPSLRDHKPFCKV